jgi:ATP-dependent Zn protease
MGGKYSDNTKERFDKESLELVKNAYLDAKTILIENKESMEIIIQKLLKNEVLTGKEMVEFISKKQ